MLHWSGRRVQPYICYRRVCGLSMFVLSMLYPNDTLTGFAKATKTCPAAKRYWRPLNSKRSLPVLKWTSESEYFLSFKTETPVQEQSLYPSLRMRGAG